MEKLVINSYEEFESYLGKDLGTSEWLEIDQDRINKFADATLDHQWIHVDVERAKEESPFKSTIAHGYLTLSILPYLWAQIIQVNNISMLVNYGMDKMRFGQAVITGSRVRMTAKLHNIQNLRGIAKVEIDFKIEIEGQRKPALQGIASFLLPLPLQQVSKYSIFEIVDAKSREFDSFQTTAFEFFVGAVPIKALRYSVRALSLGSWRRW